MVATPVFITLQDAIDLVDRRKYGSRRGGVGGTPVVQAIGAGRAHTHSSLYSAVHDIATALRDGIIHAQGAVPNGVGRFEDIPIQFWQYADLDVNRAITGGRSPITERSHAMPVLCYDRLILFREEIDKMWPAPPAPVTATSADDGEEEALAYAHGLVLPPAAVVSDVQPPVPPADRACDRRPWWRRIFG